MQVKLSHPDRSVVIKGPKKARDLLRELNLTREAHLVIRGDELVTEDEWLKEDDLVEIRPVISGGSRDPNRPPGESVSKDQPCTAPSARPRR
jgi:sulfur carrier protein